MNTNSHSGQQRPNPFESLVEAMGFLTIIPVPMSQSAQGNSFGAAIRYFPVVGVLIGALLWAVGLLFDGLWGGGVRAVAIVIAWGVVTAGLHLDGLSDTFDGVMSWRGRERKLEIMRDSRIGVMGALALAAVLGLKVALLASAAVWTPAVLLAPALGRWAMCYGLCGYQSARSDGLGAMARTQSNPATLRHTTVVAAVAALLIAGVRGLVALALVWLVSRALARWWNRDLGGLTGDTYGALCELGEVVALAVLVARL